MSVNQNPLSADSPLRSPDQDELGYAQFAEHLARSITTMSPSDGFVISINGPWGSGKSTVINFVIHYLEQIEANRRPLVIQFNPWWFSGREDLTRSLIGQLMVGLGEKDFKDLKNVLANFAEGISKIPIPYSRIGESVASTLRKQPDLAALKDKINKLLVSQNKKILVIIDDIDRLNPDEVRDLFRTIKATANFPNVIYLLAFDTQIVIEALEQGFIASKSGQRYLEKIVQVPFELPLPDQVELRKLLFHKLDQILGSTAEGFFDHAYWIQVYFKSIDHFITTPRKIVRLINVLQATYPTVVGEVNPVDFIAIEALRVFRSETYDIVRRNSDLLVGDSRYSWDNSDHKKREQIYQIWLEKVPESDRDAVKQLLINLFPKFAQPFTNIHYGGEFLSNARRYLRICSPDIFPTYFRFNISNEAISAVELKTLLARAEEISTFEDQLVTYTTRIQRDGTTRVRAILERLQDFTEDVPVEHIPSIIQAFLNIGDKLLMKQDDHRGMFDFGNDVRIDRIINQLLRRLTEEVRYQILMKAIEDGEALSTTVRLLTLYGQQHGKYGSREPSSESEKVLNLTHMDELERIVLDKIRESAQKRTLLKTPNLSRILWSWKTWAENENEVKEWVSDIIKDGQNLGIFFEQFCSFHLVAAVGDLAAKKKLRLNPKWLETFVNPDEIIDRARNLESQNNLTEDQINASKQFVKEYDLLKQGINPDNPW